MIKKIPNGYVYTFLEHPSIDLLQLQTKSFLGLLNIIDVIPAYDSIGLIFKKGKLPKLDTISEFIVSSHSKSSTTSKNIKIVDVCYDKEYGTDLEFIAKYNHLTIDEVIKIHAGAIYTVAMIGFLPGFTYLKGLDPRLSTPRKNTPSKKVIKSSVAIAGDQTGIYPSNSPGGWQIIGLAKIDLFDVHRDPPNIFSIGDKVAFRPILKSEFLENE